MNGVYNKAHRLDKGRGRAINMNEGFYNKIHRPKKGQGRAINMNKGIMEERNDWHRRMP